ncbi:MAG: hypothetical protein ACI97X_000120, partial [Oceanospirillaceae bacterium]
CGLAAFHETACWLNNFGYLGRATGGYSILEDRTA